MAPRMKKKITVVTPCYNEVDNVGPLFEAVKAEFEKNLPEYDFEHLFLDNASRDGTQDALRRLAASDPRVKVILNARNFGHIRSPYYGLLQASGDAALMLVADFQDPPSLIPQFVRKWAEGWKAVIGVKTQTDETWLMFTIRSFYYKLVTRLSEVDLTKNATGFGIYDRWVLDLLRKIREPYPYFRGLVPELGVPTFKIDYRQPLRKRGITKNNFYTLYDMAMLGITNHSRVPLRIATMTGFLMSGVSLLVAVGYFLAKLVFWQWFTLGLAPLVVGLFFFSSVQLFFIGILGEYIGAILTQVKDRPLIVEKERINF